MAATLPIRWGLEGSEELQAKITQVAQTGQRALEQGFGQGGAKAAQGVQLARYEVQNLGRQATDAFVQLSGGQSFLTVLIQQGPQAVDAVGGVSRAVSLLKQNLLPIAALVAAGTTAWAAYKAVAKDSAVDVKALAEAQERLNAALFSGAAIERAKKIEQNLKDIDTTKKALAESRAEEKRLSENLAAGGLAPGVAQRMQADLALAQAEVGRLTRNLAAFEEKQGVAKDAADAFARSLEHEGRQASQSAAKVAELGAELKKGSQAYEDRKKVLEAQNQAEEKARAGYERDRQLAIAAGKDLKETLDERVKTARDAAKAEAELEIAAAARQKTEQEAKTAGAKASREAEQAEKQHAEALRQANEAAGRQIEQYAQAEEQVDKRIKGLTDENEILRLLATGYDENSVAVTALKTAKAQAAIESERSIALSKAAADANDKEAKSVEELAKGNVDAAIKLHDLAQEILTVKIPGINAKYDAEAAAAAENQRLKAMSDTNKEVARHFEQVLNEANRGVADVFNELFTGKITGLGEFFKRVLARQASEGLAEAFSPLTASVLGAFIPGYSQYRLKQSTALTPAGGGGLNSLFSGASNASTLYNVATNPGFFTLAGNPLATLGSNVSGFFGGATLATPAALGAASLAETGGLSAVAAAYGVPLSEAASVVGSGAEAALAPLEATGYGAAIAAGALILMSVLGGLFDRKPTPAAGALLDIGTGAITDVKTKALDDAYVTKTVQELYPKVQSVIDRYGLSLGAGTRIGAGTSINKESGEQYFDLKLIGPDSAEGVAKFFHQIDFNAKDAASAAEAMSRLTLAIIQESDAAATAEGANVKAAAATLKLSDAASLIDKVLAGAERFDKGLGAAADQLVAISAAAREFAAGAVTTIKDYLDIGTRIGGEAGKAAVQVSRDYLDTLLGLKDAAPVLSEAAAAFAQAKAAIIDLAPALAAANYSPEEIAARQSVATEALTRRTRDAFYRNLAARANPALGQIDQLVAQHTADLNDAAALFGAGATSGTDAANSAFATAVDGFLKSLQPDALAGVLVDVATKADSASQYIARAAGALVQAGQAAQHLSLSSPTNFDPGSALGRLAGILAQADPTGAKRSLGYLDRGDAFVDLINQVGRNPTIESVANLDGRLNLFGDRLQNGLPGQRSTAARIAEIAQQAAQAAEGGSLFKATNDNGAGVLASFGHSRAEYLGALRRLTGVRRLSETTDISGLSEQQIIEAITAQRDEMTAAHLAGAGVLGGTIATTRGVRDVDQRFAAGRSGTDFLSAATSLRDAEAEGRRQRERQLTVAQRQLGANEQAVRLLGEIVELIRTQPQALANLLNTARSSADTPYRSTANGLKWGA